MTTPNIPALPRELVEDADDSPGSLVLEASTEPKWGSHYIRFGSGSGAFFDPADLIRNLAPFVRIPAEATLAAEGLLVGPGEPAASEGEPVAWLDRDGRPWRMGERLMMSARGCPDTTRATVERVYGPLAPLYTHPPVTAEAATAPSVEQIAEVFAKHEYNPRYDGLGAECDGCSWSVEVEPSQSPKPEYDRHIAEEIRALWSPAPGDADRAELTDARERAGRYAEDANREESRAEKAEARVKALEALIAPLGLDPRDVLAERDHLRCENEHLRAALEAAEEALRAEQENHRATVGLYETGRQRREAGERHTLAAAKAIAASAKATAARAAVEADTTEEA